jgi:hypothetical protein
MSALLDTALAWLLWTSMSWATLALGMAVWFRLRPPQTATVRHAALAAVILAGTLGGLLPRWGSGVIVVTTTAVEAPTVVTPPPVEMEAAGHVAAVSNSGPLPAASAREVEPLIPGRDGQGRPLGGLEASARDIEPPISAIVPAVVDLRDWYALGNSVFATAWLLGALLMNVRLVRAVRMTQRWRREARPLPDSEQAVFATLRRELQVRRATRAGSHDEPAAPLVLCGWPPLVVVPGDWSTWDDRSRRAAWRHELAHVRRRDDWWRMLSEVLRVVWWFHPGVRWLLLRREHEAELLSDEATVAAGCPPHWEASTESQFRGYGNPKN